MRVTVEATGALERRVDVALPAERVEQMFKDRLTQFSRTARLKGFRPGKIPVKVIEQQFGAQLRDEVVNELVRTSFSEAISRENLSPVGGPRIQTLTAPSGEELRYSAVFEVYPTVSIAPLSALRLTRLEAEVTPADVDAMLENLRRQRVTYRSVSRAAKASDQVRVDFEGKLDGVAFDGGSATGAEIVLGAGRMLPDFEKGLDGVTAGETRTFPVSFPVDYGQPSLAGRTAEFTVTAHDVAEEVLPEINDDFCLAFGVTEGGVETLRREVEDNMRRELANTVRARMKTELFDALIAANPVEVPQGALEEQIQQLQADWLRRMGVSPEQLTQAPPRDPFEATARRRVVLSFLIGEIARTEGLAPDPVKVEEQIEAAALGFPDPDNAARQIRDNPQLMNQVRSAAIEEQVVDRLLAVAAIESKPATFKEIMNFGA